MRYSVVRAFGSIVIACSIAFSIAASAEARSVLHRGNASEPDTLDPQKANIVPDQVIIGDLYNTLVTSDALGNNIPGDASHWEISEDGLTYTFYLRQGLKWSDGSPLTALDYWRAFGASIRRRQRARPPPMFTC